MTDTEGRPEPEALLAEAAKEGRGKLEIRLLLAVAQKPVAETQR
jgi:hypothetical protein